MDFRLRINPSIMRLQLVSVILMAAILATVTSKNSAMPSLGDVPLDLPEHDPQNSKEINITDDSVVREKVYQPPSASENLLYFVLGVVIIVVLVSSCHLVFAMVCKTDRMHERAFDRMLNEDRHRGQQYDRVAQWTRNPPTVRFPTHPEISLPLIDIPSSIQVYPQDPFAFNHTQGPRAPRRVTISSPCVTGTSQL